jgi:hypothetical protein
MLHRMITHQETRRRTLARFELAFEATRRPELRVCYDDMGQPFRSHAARLLAGSRAEDAGCGRAWPGADFGSGAQDG